MINIVIKEQEKVIIPILWTGKETELSYTIKLAGAGANVTILALLCGKETQKIHLKLNIYHQKPETRSRVIVKGAITDSASINFDGLVKIEPGAKGTNAWLAAHILLLSDKTKGSATPSLEIEENDIKAGHATTVGKVNDLELFYLMSRGIPEQTAKALIVQGFLESVLKEFPDELAKKARKKIEYM
jgi:Fe-S cluster assembly protein SufD